MFSQNYWHPPHYLSSIVEQSQVSESPNKSLLQTYHVSDSESSNSNSIIKQLSIQIQYLRTELFKKEQQRSVEIREIKRTVGRLEVMLGKEMQNGERASEEIQRLTEQNRKLREEIERLKRKAEEGDARRNESCKVDIESAKRQIAELSTSNKKATMKYQQKTMHMQSDKCLMEQTPHKSMQIYDISPSNSKSNNNFKQRLERLDREISLGKEKISRRKLSKCLTEA